MASFRLAWPGAGVSVRRPCIIVHAGTGLLLNLYDQYPELQRDRNFGYRGVAMDASGAMWLGGDFGVYRVKIRQTIAENMDNAELGIAQLCSAMHLSHTQVFRKMKALTGENPTIYIRKARLHHAMELLRTTDRNISQVAYDVGFTDPNYFSRVFSEEFGMPPSGVRK